MSTTGSITETAVPLAANEIQIIHFIPGRLRFKLRHLKNDAGMAGMVRQVLSNIPGIRSVEINPITSSVLIHYDPEVFQWDNPAVRAIAPGLFPDDLSPEMYEDWLRMHTNGDGQPDLKQQIESAAASMNRRVHEATRGSADLTTVIPLALVAMGIGTVVVSRRLPMPKWYDFFWFALGTYTMFRGIERR